MAERDAKGHWLPGTSGNPNGRPRDTFTPILVEKYSDEENVRVLVDKLHEMAFNGNMQAMAYVIDRFLGKPRQSVELSGEGVSPVRIEILAGDGNKDSTGQFTTEAT